MLSHIRTRGKNRDRKGARSQTRDNKINMQTTKRLLTTSAIALFALITIAAQAEDGPRQTFEQRCSGCHTLDKLKVGPPLRNIYGNKAGSDKTFLYSDALKNSKVVWDDATLDHWLVDTDSVAPGNDMPFRLNNKEERTKIIAYLKELAKK